MKRLVSALFVAAALALTSCGSGEPVNSSSPTISSPALSAKASPTINLDPTKRAADAASASALAEQPFSVSYACTTPAGSHVNSKTIEDVREQGLKSCRALLVGYVPSAVEARAVELASPGSASIRTDLDHIYNECAASGTASFGSDDSDPKLLEALDLLCPGAARPAPAPTPRPATTLATPPADPNASKKVAKDGSFFVGSQILPGVWQSDLERVTNCYWEISDAQGDIVENNFINLAPQISIVIPADAVGFTARGCGFHWVSEQ